MKTLLIAGCSVLLAACSSTPAPADWQINALQSSERAVSAYLEGNIKVEQAEAARANREVARTGRPDLLARLALRRCAAALASLDLLPCNEFENYRADANPAELAYAGFLRVTPGALPSDKTLDLNQLPVHHRAVAAATTDLAAAQAVKAIADPLARLVAAGVMFRRNLASPDLIDNAIDTASEQGWRRPLLAWLKLQLARAQLANTPANSATTAAIDKLQRRIAVLQEQWPKP
jgi:hypothetical protein